MRDKHSYLIFAMGLLAFAALLFIVPPLVTYLLSDDAPLPWVVVDSDKMDVLAYVGCVIAAFATASVSLSLYRLDKKAAEERRKEQIKPWFSIESITMKNGEKATRNARGCLSIAQGNKTDFSTVSLKNVGKGIGIIDIDRRAFGRDEQRAPLTVCEPGGTVDVSLPLIPFSGAKSESVSRPVVTFKDVDGNCHEQEIKTEWHSVPKYDDEGAVAGEEFAVDVLYIDAPTDSSDRCNPAQELEKQFDCGWFS